MKRILVADDDVVMIRLYQIHLARGGFETLVFKDGLEVVPGARAAIPDLAILDYLLPGKSGLDIIRSFKTDEALADIPIIVVTGQGKIHLKGSLLEAGADEVYTKPFSPSLLVKKINELLDTA